MGQCRDLLKLEDGTKSDRTLEDAITAYTVPIADFHFSGGCCRVWGGRTIKAQSWHAHFWPELQAGTMKEIYWLLRLLWACRS